MDKNFKGSYILKRLYWKYSWIWKAHKFEKHSLDLEKGSWIWKSSSILSSILIKNVAHFERRNKKGTRKKGKIKIKMEHKKGRRKKREKRM